MMTSPTRKSIPAVGRHVAGVGLIEVLIAVVILAFGMLGIAALQATALRNGQSSLERSQAVVKTYAILDRMRANSGAARIGKYDLNTFTCTAPAVVAGDLPSSDLHDWIDSLQDGLGASACGKIVCGTTECTIEVQWDDSRGTNANTAEQTKTLKTETRL